MSGWAPSVEPSRRNSRAWAEGGDVLSDQADGTDTPVCFDHGIQGNRATIIETFHWVIYIFGAFLIFTGAKMLATINQKPDMEGNRLVRLIRRHFRVTENYEGHHFFTRRDGLLYLTPLMVVLILIEVTDVVFALDSIPAIFAITTDPFIVYTSNVFAILGLRALYFALAGIIYRFHYLKYGLSLVLIAVGAKMLVNAAFGKVIPTEAALLVTALLIGGSILFSIIKTRRLPKEVATAEAIHGWVPGSPPRESQPRNGRLKNNAFFLHLNTEGGPSDPRIGWPFLLMPKTEQGGHPHPAMAMAMPISPPMLDSTTASIPEQQQYFALQRGKFDF